MLCILPQVLVTTYKNNDVQHRTVLIIFPLILHTVIVAQTSATVKVSFLCFFFGIFFTFLCIFFWAVSSFFFQSVLRWSIAVSTICRHSSRVVAFLQAVARPKLRGPRSASIAWSQVWLGLPAGHFQSGGTCRIHAARARWWSLRGELRAIWPKSRRHLLVTR